MPNAEAARMQRTEGGTPPADIAPVFKLEPLQLQKLDRKAEAPLLDLELEAELEEARSIASCEISTVASHDGWASDGFQEAVDHAHADDSAQGQRDESARQQWPEACPAWQQPFAVGGQASTMGGFTPMAHYLMPMQVMFVMLQPATPQAYPEAVPQPFGPALPHGSAPCPAQQRHHEDRRRTAHPARIAQQEYFNQMLNDLGAGGDRCAAALARLVGQVRRASMDGVGCRVVQLALEVADRVTAAILVQELHGHVLQLIRSPHGNHVVQKILERLPPEPADFVARELRGCAAEMARHRFGCRVIIRLMEHCADTLMDEGRAALLEELLAEVASLCRHSFGHHVITAILEHAHPVHRQSVLDFLCTGAADKAQDRFHSYVVESALESGAAEETELLARALLGDTPANVISLSQTRYGSLILRILLGVAGPSERFHCRRPVPVAVSQKALDSLRTAAPRLRQTPGGSQLLRDAGLPA